MFTGIIQEVGILKGKNISKESFQLVIKASKVLNEVSRGDSIAVNGVCLTVIDFTCDTFTADVMTETLKATNLQQLKKRSRVNLEQAVRADGFFGGHLLTGHVDGQGVVNTISNDKNAWLVELAVDPQLSNYMVDKGSVAVNGVSLTIMRIMEDKLTISLIPETRKTTNLGTIQVGDRINVETDLIGKYIFKMLNKQGLQGVRPGINKDFLRENGFL